MLLFILEDRESSFHIQHHMICLHLMQGGLLYRVYTDKISIHILVDGFVIQILSYGNLFGGGRIKL